MATPDVRLVQGRRIVDAVAGHRHDVSPGAKGPRDSQLVLWRDSRHDDAVMVQRRLEHVVVGWQLRPDENGGLRVAQSHGIGDGGCCRRVVAGDHGDPDAGPAAGGQ